jgi:hypothetical protein
VLERLARIEQRAKDTDRFLLPRVEELCQKMDKVLAEQARMAIKLKLAGGIAGAVAALVVAAASTAAQAWFGG